MSARVASGHFYDGDGFFLVSGAPAEAALERASQLTITSAGPLPPDRGIAAATQTLWQADGNGRTPRVRRSRPAGRFCTAS
jgi:hypothetical protein